MKLLSIELINFKGVKTQKVITGGNSITIRGANGAGKTTIMDAWLWLLFGKDSTGRSTFEVKTLNGSGQPIHGLDHIVEAVVENEGLEIKLRKEYREKWVKKRGDSEAQLTGHETSCFIDEVPVKISDYTARIGELVNEELFKLLSDPAQFQRLDWKKRRELMLSLIDSDDDGLIHSMPFAGIAELVEKHGTDDAMVLLKDRRKKLNDQIKQIPVRIDEASRNAPESPETFDIIKAKETLAELLKKRADIEQVARDAAKKRIDEQTGTMEAIQLHKNQIREWERIEREYKTESLAAAQRVDNLKKTLESNSTWINDFDKTQDSIRKMIADYEKERIELVAQYKAVKAKELNVAEVDTACPTCGQDLPADKGSEMIEAARAKFEAQKKKELDEITRQGGAFKSKIEALLVDLNQGEDKLASVRREIIELNAQLAESEKAAGIKAPDYSDNYKRTNELIEHLNESLKSYQAPADEPDLLAGEIAHLQRMIANQDVIEAAKKRVAELEAEGKKYASELVATEGLIYTLEEYIKAKVEKVETELNGLFSSVTFKLFDRQLNGGISETFVTLIDGVPFADANTAAQINAGLEIIEHLSKHYGLRVPCFVDHRESVTHLVPINSQIINLLVDENHKQLKIEMEA